MGGLGDDAIGDDLEDSDDEGNWIWHKSLFYCLDKCTVFHLACSVSSILLSMLY